MIELTLAEIELVSGGTTDKQKPQTVFQQIRDQIAAGNFGAAIGMIMDNPFTLTGSMVDSVLGMIGPNSQQSRDVADALSKYQVPAE